jgi:DNA-binding transcriptional MerR regulator
MENRYFRVGELAHAAGVSVRTLHHYEALGLLDRAERTDSGHRLYRADDVSRLYQVLALRSLGLGLADIGGVLDNGEGTLLQVVRRHLDEVQRTIEAQNHLRSRLDFLLHALEKEQQPSVDRFLEAMEAMTMFERYLSPEQLAQLRERHRQMGDEAVKRGEQQWAELIKDCESAREEGVDPASPRAQELARRMGELVQAFTGGDPGIHGAVERMYQNEGVVEASHGTINPVLWEYMGRIRSAAS